MALPRNHQTVANLRHVESQRKRNAAVDAKAVDDPAAQALFERARALKESRKAQKPQQQSASPGGGRRVTLPMRRQAPSPATAVKPGSGEDVSDDVDAKANKSPPKKRS